MAVVNVSLDTSTRQVVLTVNGVLVPASNVFIEKSDYDGETRVTFGYTVERTDPNGMKERRYFYLPSPEEIATESHSGLNDDGFASKAVYDDNKAKADVIAFLCRNKSNE